MNFFEYQDKARSSTKLLVFLFACAVTTLVALTTLLAVFALALARRGDTASAPMLEQARAAPEIFVAVSAVVLTIVLLGAIFRLLQLRGGGKAVAESLDGRLLNVATRDAQERKLLNVVEEMAIAAGMPVPQVYVIDDPAINAFAAGYQQQDAVIGITRGCIEQLDRDELQGVVAHEFSHILNGDMRLNIRLIGWLYGITVIGLIGHHLTRARRYARQSSVNRRGGGIPLLGLGLIVMGYGGTFFGKLIKAAVSRQREYLADASAVQFTRNIDGIGGALKKIGAHSAGSRITAVDTHEIGHMLFGPGAGFGGAFATHPPLEQRIRRIDPHWDGSFVPARPAPPQSAEAAATATRDAQQVFATVGMLTAAGLAEARSRLQSLPPGLHEALHNTHDSLLLVAALLVADSTGDMRREQLRYVQRHLQPADWSEFVRALADVANLERKLYLPLIELAVPALRQLSAAQCETSLALLRHLIDIDANVSLFEWCLFRMVRLALVRNAEPRKARYTLAHCVDASRTLLAALARAGNDDERSVNAAFAAGWQQLGVGNAANTELPATGDMQALDAALDCLVDLEPLQKPRLLKALAHCARADGRITLDEQELLRAVGVVLDCPTPPPA